MEIKYKNTLDGELLEATKLQWRYMMRKHIQILFVCIMVAIGLLVWGLSSANTSSFWNLKTTFGIVYMIVVFIYAISLYQSRTKLIANCKRAIDAKNKYSIEYTFTDEKVMIKEVDAYAETDWSSITGYRVHNNFLFLYLRSSESSWFTIDRNDMPKSDFETLLVFVSKQILPQK